MKLSILFLLLLIALGSLSSQPSQSQVFNLGLEQVDSHRQMPKDWTKEGNHYRIALDSLTTQGGKYALVIESQARKKEEAFGEEAYGATMYKIPSSYEGKTLELQAYMRLEGVSQGFAGLHLSLIDGEGRNIDFNNMQERNLNGTTGWQRYSIQLPLAEEAQFIYLGAFLTGAGKLWVDEFRLFLDGKDITQAPPKKPKTYLAQQDKEFDAGSLVKIPPLTPDLIESVVVLGKVWGFVKYYHPSIAQGEHNWDYELFRILPAVVKATGREDRNQLLSQWVANLGPLAPSLVEERMDTLKSKLRPDLAWIEDQTQLGKDLSRQLMEVRKSARTNSHYYIGQAPKVGNPIFKHEDGYEKFSYPDAGYRLLALFRYWNMIQYYFPYKHLIEEDWQKVLPAFVPKFIQAADALSYQLAVLELITNIDDTHAILWGQEAVIAPYKGENYASLEVAFVEEKAVVTDYFDNQLGKKTGLQKGDIILKVNHETVEAIIQRKLPFTPASNYATKLDRISRDLLRTNGSQLQVSYERAGKVVSAIIDCYPPEQANLFISNKYRQKDTCARFVAEKIGYIYPGSIKNAYLPKIMSSFQDTKGIIIDLRCYPSEFIVFTLGDYLMEKPTDFVKFTVGSIQQPGLFTFTPPLEVGKNRAEPYRGKVVILVNETTQSQAEYTTMAFRVAPRATVIGSTTAAADGNVSQISLPGGINTMISGIGVYYPDGRETQRIGIVPDIEVKPTIKGVRAGKDEVLEKAIELISKEK